MVLNGGKGELDDEKSSRGGAFASAGWRRHRLGDRTERGATLAAEQASAMKLELKIGEKEVAARLIDNETRRDFVSLLPLSITMNDLFNREKSEDLPRRISEGGQGARTYEVGDRIDDAYRAKYRSSEYLNSMIGTRARSATIKIIPREITS